MEVRTTFPDILNLKDWDLILLKRYVPVFKKPVKTCSLCSLGPCRPLNENPGKCGISEDSFRARYALLDAVIGASAHTSNARRLLTDMINKYGGTRGINMGDVSAINTPLTTLICGIEPAVLSDMEDIISYIERQLTHLLSSVSFGSEADKDDFVSKTLHAGMLDNLAAEVTDIIQISSMNMPKGSSADIINFGIAEVDTSKFVVLIIGHNSVVSHNILHMLEEKKTANSFEICGLCCSAIDGSRHSHGHGFKIIGSQSMQLEFIKTGIADVVVLDTQCIRADIVEEAVKSGSIIIATAEETVMGLDDISGFPLESITRTLIETRSGFIGDKNKAAEAVIKIGASRSAGSGGKGQKGQETWQMPVGRGAIRDGEIRSVAPSVIMGEIPGIVGIFGCPEEEGGQRAKNELETRDLRPETRGFVFQPGVRGLKSGITHNMADEFLKRGYIVSTGGCASIDAARGGIFKKTSDIFDGGNITNLGSCVSISHLIGACIKITKIMSHREINGNYEEIADYIINKVGAVIILWGAFTQKAFATAVGAARLGIPVIFGPRGRYYGLHLVKSEQETSVIDARTGNEVKTHVLPECLLYSVQNFEEALYTAAKLTMRHNDTPSGRRTKLKNYIELYKGAPVKRGAKDTLPEDIHFYVRTNYDIPEGMGDEINPILEQNNWQLSSIPDPTFLKRIVRLEKGAYSKPLQG